MEDKVKPVNQILHQTQKLVGCWVKFTQSLTKISWRLYSRMSRKVLDVKFIFLKQCWRRQLQCAHAYVNANEVIFPFSTTYTHRFPCHHAINCSVSYRFFRRMIKLVSPQKRVVFQISVLVCLLH